MSAKHSYESFFCVESFLKLQLPFARNAFERSQVVCPFSNVKRSYFVTLLFKNKLPTVLYVKFLDGQYIKFSSFHLSVACGIVIYVMSPLSTSFNFRLDMFMCHKKRNNYPIEMIEMFTFLHDVYPSEHSFPICYGKCVGKLFSSFYISEGFCFKFLLLRFLPCSVPQILVINLSGSTQSDIWPVDF